MGDAVPPSLSRSSVPVMLGKGTAFPDPQGADAQGLVAVGGDLSRERLLAAYRGGIFPWSAHPLTWWSPDPRAIIQLDELHIPRSLERALRRASWTVTRDTAFAQVIQACAQSAPGREETWIDASFIRAYTRFHEAGFAHSLEVWEGTLLVGGIYGVAVGGLFAGESMFYLAPNASKVALVRLVEHLQERGYALFDVQMLTPVTRLMGGREITRRDYLQRLRVALEVAPTFV